VRGTAVPQRGRAGPVVASVHGRALSNQVNVYGAVSELSSVRVREPANCLVGRWIRESHGPCGYVTRRQAKDPAEEEGRAPVWYPGGSHMIAAHVCSHPTAHLGTRPFRRDTVPEDTA